MNTQACTVGILLVGELCETKELTIGNDPSKAILYIHHANLSDDMLSWGY